MLRKNFIGIIAVLCQNSMRTENSEMPCRDGRPILAASYFVFARMHMLVELGPFLCMVPLAVPLAQLQSLIRWDYLSQASDLEAEARTGLKQTRYGQSNCSRQCGTRRAKSP